MMTRNLITLFSFLCLSALTSVADNQEIEVTLNPSNNYSDTINLKDMAELVVNVTPNNDNETARITVELKNNTAGDGLLLFKENYTEKETKNLKNEFFKIEWIDWLKTDGRLQKTPGLKQKVFFIDHGETKALPLQMTTVNKNGTQLTLAIYGCLIKDRDKNTAQPSKVRIRAREVFPIKVNVELGPDTEFEAFKQQCEDFILTIREKTFCPSDNHQRKHKDLQGQLEEFANQCKAKRTEIERFAFDHNGIMKANITGTKYQQLINDLQQAYDDKMRDVRSEDPSCIKSCGPDAKTCGQCGKVIGSGKGQCHYKGSHPVCETHNKLIGTGKKNSCTKNHPLPPPLHGITWSKANAQLDNIYKQHNRGKINSKQAKSQAQSIVNQAKGATDVDHKKAAMRKYDLIMKCE